MTTANEELIAQLRGQAYTTSRPDQLCEQAATLLQSQAERIASLEAECEVERLRLAACGVAALGYFDGCKDEYKSASLDDVLRLNDTCDTLRTELKVAHEGWRCECSTDDACRFARERDTLRAQLAEIEKAEPVASIYINSAGVREFDDWGNPLPKGRNQLFTRPMPAQDVTELVKDAERWRFMMWWQDQNPRPESIQNCLTDMHRWARARGALGPNSEELQRAIDAALSKYKGAK